MRRKKFPRISCASDKNVKGSVWTSTAIDADSKLIPTFHVGTRDAACACEFKHAKHPHSYATWLKRARARMDRRRARRDPEAAPTKRGFRGYSD